MLGSRQQLIWWLPSHSGSWPPQGQNPFDLEFDQSNHLEPVFNFECPSRPGELRVPPAGLHPGGGPPILIPGMVALCTPPG